MNFTSVLYENITLYMVAECNYFHILFNLFLLEFCKKHKIARCLFPISEKKILQDRTIKELVKRIYRNREKAYRLNLNL
ncbi:hypothetical protein CW667_03525 [Candidatus Bathyarchaeota archaeon]|nr:MAG: hypothetical protein CW667_03525 [Candidatus Bathyarchaeota archaeon]